MIKYYALPLNNLSYIYSHLNSDKDKELKLLILYIQMH